MPLRTRPLRSGGALVVDDAGAFTAASDALVARLGRGAQTPADLIALSRGGHVFDMDDDFSRMAFAYRRAQRLTRAQSLDYLILVPTLRCNLSCTYCQVSRVGATQSGFDWSDDTLAGVLRLIDSLPGDFIKIEFQGGEPTLRPDLLRAVIQRCERFATRQFVICSNLQSITADLLDIFDRPDVLISTSLDGDAATHGRNRTKEAASTATFAKNLERLLARYAPGKLSALPTVDPTQPPDIDGLIDAYASRGLESIFLRPINYQGFARKRHSDSREQSDAWRTYYEQFVRRIIERNWHDQSRVLEETYFSICLRRIFRPGRERHVDLRNPNPVGVDYVVIDHDGIVYPTDEARMLARSGVIDLAIGDVHRGWDTDARTALNYHATNEFDPACQRCAYQPFCGRDLVDDIARYGRADVPRLDTAFCRRHLHLFDFIFELIYSDDDAVQHSLARWLRLPGTPAALGPRLQ
ncbi:His-Xaa-Ser system radical SAM maturase HxsB [Sphingomonas panacisoli]|nr:His-Xaa-Ser system radical SAM maturase HxsB [Sphingomonas panacisoli]